MPALKKPEVHEVWPSSGRHGVSHTPGETLPRCRVCGYEPRRGFDGELICPTNTEGCPRHGVGQAVETTHRGWYASNGFEIPPGAPANGSDISRAKPNTF